MIHDLYTESERALDIAWFAVHVELGCPFEGHEKAEQILDAYPRASCSQQS